MNGGRVYTFGKSTFEVVFGDIVTSDAEVLVSSDDFMLSAGGGVSAAIAHAAGSAFRVDASKVGALSLGDVAVTSAGALRARFVFHVITIGPRTDHSDDIPTVLSAAVRRSLSLLVPLGVRSIAFPALGTGAAHYSIEATAMSMTGEIVNFLSLSKVPLSVSLYLRGRNGREETDYFAFYEQLGRLTAQHPSESRAEPPTSRSEHQDISTIRTLELERERVRLENLLQELVDKNGNIHKRLQIEKELRLNLVRRMNAAAGPNIISVRPAKIFISYAHADEQYRNELVTALAGLKQQGKVEDWHDRKIVPGDKWNQEIAHELEQADIILFLISSNFMASDFITSFEVKRALERHEIGTARLIPIMIRKTYWKDNPLSSLQGLPNNLVPVVNFQNRDDAYFEIVSGIANAVESLTSSAR